VVKGIQLHIMLCINLLSTDPFFNLAVEEYLLKNSNEEYFLLYVDYPSVIIGKHQVAHREADTKFISENNIPVIRRISGGGTVFHDEGNLNFSFISQSTHGKQVDFRKYTLPVIEFLFTLGVAAVFEGKNDLKFNGLKISGNAEHVYRERVLHHGTLLFDTKIDTLRASIRKDQSCYSTRAVASNPSSVMNLKDKVEGINDFDDFRKKMVEFFANRTGNISMGLSPQEISEAENLAETKFHKWEWNFAYGPEYHFSNKFEIKGIPHSCRLFVKDGIIQECEIEGSGEMSASGVKLISCRHMPEDLRKVFLKENILILPSEIFKFF
jgi:lipoate-protein ligase A